MKTKEKQPKEGGAGNMLCSQTKLRGKSIAIKAYIKKKK